jgi:hypothetical protein
LRREHPALRGGRLWHLASDDTSYVFLRESEEERVVVAFNNSDQTRELRVPLTGTPVKEAAGVSRLFGEAQASLDRKEFQLSMPGQSLSIFTLD